ncbi:hypothetical protein [Soonwooa sp.]|uniref:hypothetical protein n=1 Tax=Soonwooa sp. TaxID=1938592 RepID=UPI002608000B|nr:hypothetical protein [Soonwooa sp.]
MKVILFILVHIGIFCFSQEDKCKRFTDSLNAPFFEKKLVLSKKFEKITIKPEDTLYGYYEGIAKQFSKDNYLIIRSSNSYIKRINQCVDYIYNDWHTVEYYTKKGNLVNRASVFYHSVRSGETYTFNKQKKAIRSEGMGDVLFKMKIEDFVKILEQNNITPRTTKMRTGSEGKIFINKHITPAGRFWEYQLMFEGVQPFISILISDATGKVVAKSYDMTPKDATNEMTTKYGEVKYFILYPKNDGFVFNENQIAEILRKNDINETAINIKKYAGRTWLIQTRIDPRGVKEYEPVMLLIDDTNGNILIDLNTYEKNIYGEEKFIKDFNAILLKRKNTTN